MDKTKSKFRRFIKIIYNPFSIIIITLIIVITTLTYFLYSNVKINKDLLELEKLLIENEKSYAEEAKKLEEIKENVNFLKNIEAKTIEKKNYFFENAKKYEDKVLAGKGSKKIVYITIDDGPYSLTPSFLNTLDKYDILATFFLLGKTDEKYDAIYKRIASSGHTVANHTYSHGIRKGLYSSTNSFINDVLKQEKFLQNKVGVKTNIVRFPGGSATANSTLRKLIIKRLRTINYGYIDWNVSSGDGGGHPTVEILYNNVINGVKNKKVSVVLMHDYSNNTLKALPLILNKLTKEDYVFLPLFYESSMVRK